MKSRKKFIISVIGIIAIIIVMILSISSRKIQEITINEYELSEFEVMDNKKYAIVYNTANLKSYLVQVGSNGFHSDFYLLGDKIFNFQSYSDGKLYVHGEHVTYTFNPTLDDSIEEDNKVIYYGLIRVDYDSINQEMQCMSYKNEVGCHIPILQYNSYIIIDLIET